MTEMDPNPYEPSQLPLREETPPRPRCRPVQAVVCGALGGVFITFSLAMVVMLLGRLAINGRSTVEEVLGVCGASFVCGTFGASLYLLAIDSWRGTERLALLAFLLLVPFLLMLVVSCIMVMVRNFGP